MASARQIEANRRNAQKSTGPKSEQGKQATRLNGLKHGLHHPSAPPLYAHSLRPASRAQAGTVTWHAQLSCS